MITRRTGRRAPLDRGARFRRHYLALSSVAAWAGPYEDAVAAYQRGDYEAALNIWRPLAEGGDAIAQANVGLMYDSGVGVSQDYTEAAKWYRLAAVQGNAMAQFNLGLLYDNGTGVGQDYREALKWYRSAAAQGIAGAENSLGVMFQFGRGVPRDTVEAVKWYRLAAAQGYATAQFNLGASYNVGMGVSQDYAEAAKWCRLAAVQGHRSAQIILGVLNQNGQGVAQDPVRAYMWFNLAESSAIEQERMTAIADRDAIARLMKPWQIAQAHEMAMRCWQSAYRICGEPENNQIATAAPPAKKSTSRGKLNPTTFSTRSVRMHVQGGTYVVLVLINNAITLDFVVDSGSTDVSIPADVVLTLTRTGTIRPSDFLGSKIYALADGSKVPSETFRIRSLKVGDIVLENVTGSVADVHGSLLLGQSFLARFKAWSIDNTTHSLVLQ